jgi:hypothetical protein
MSNNSINAEFWVGGNIAVREMKFEKVGDVVVGHKHNFDHTTYVAKGSLKIEQLDENGSVIKSVIKDSSMGKNFVLIKAEVTHRITALEDNSIGHCIYAHRTPQGEVVQHYDGWKQSYE